MVGGGVGVEAGHVTVSQPGLSMTVNTGIQVFHQQTAQEIKHQQNACSRDLSPSLSLSF